MDSSDGAGDTAISSFNRSFRVHYLGSLEGVGGVEGKGTAQQAALLTKVEQAQLEQKLLLTGSENDVINLVISRHGIRLDSLSLPHTAVRGRHPLHTIVQGVSADDGLGEASFLLHTNSGTSLDTRASQLHLFQCHSKEQSDRICRALDTVFSLLPQKLASS